MFATRQQAEAFLAARVMDLAKILGHQTAGTTRTRYAGLRPGT
jgi:predicted NAD-dependent protein-ADP-ribosyltransferase YbiA (DUF1768 family)